MLATVSNAVGTSSNTGITLYELWSLFFSGFAIFISIIIPLIQFLYKKYKRLKITIIPFERTALALSFSDVGSYIRLSFCIECRNQDTTVKKVIAQVVRKSDRQTCSFEWFAFDSVYINWFGSNASNRINSMSYARPYKIKADTLEPFIIEFSGNGFDDLKRFCIERNKQLQLFRQFSGGEFKSPEDVRNKFKEWNQLEYTNMINKLSQYFFWEPDEYTITIKILHDLGKTDMSTFSFILKPDETDSLKRNFEYAIFNGVVPMQSNIINKTLS